MNKLSIFTLALILLGASVKETSDESARLWTGNSFVASIQKNTVAKSSLIAGVNAWNSGDEVAVYADGGAAVSFTAAASGESVQFNSAGPLYGSSFALVYPYAAAEGVSGAWSMLKYRSVRKRCPALMTRLQHCQ